MESAIKVLQDHGLRKTNIRVKVIDLLSSTGHAVSQPDLEHQLESEADRVTIYRTLKSLEEKGVVHKILDMAGLSKYALCKDECTDHQHKDEHLHFHCQVCGNIFCLNIPGLPDYKLPEGYSIKQMHLSAEGVCVSCSKG
jgi:Fur family ferric uptake transcriptional regulator